MLKEFRPPLPLFALLVCLCAFAQGPPDALSGRLTEHQGVPVLEVWGPPEAAGFAHGYLLAEQIVRLFDECVLDERVGVAPTAYEGVLRPATLQQFAWSPAAEAELAGLLQGVRARLGAACRSAKLDRALELADLKAINTLADWRMLMCSSFSAWDGATATGEVLTARNLDYPSTPGMRRAQLILVHRGAANGQPWIGVSWPGLVGVYTAMNAAGVTVAMHDARGLPLESPGGFTPRALALRAALESATDDYLAQVGAVFAAHGGREQYPRQRSAPAGRLGGVRFRVRRQRALGRTDAARPRAGRERAVLHKPHAGPAGAPPV